MWYGVGNKAVGLRLGFVGVICFLLVGAIQLQNYVWTIEQAMVWTK